MRSKLKGWLLSMGWQSGKQLVFLNVVLSTRGLKVLFVVHHRIEANLSLVPTQPDEGLGLDVRLPSTHGAFLDVVALVMASSPLPQLVLSML